MGAIERVARSRSEFSVHGRTVFIADSDCAAREMAAAIVAAAGAEPRQIDSGIGLLDACDSRIPDAILCSFRLPDTSIGSLTAEFARRGNRAPVVVTVDHEDISEAVRALHAMGWTISDLIEKPVDGGTLIDCLARHLPDPSEARGLVEDESPAATLARLTLREQEVLIRLVHGVTHRRIGEELGISSRTVGVYRSRILWKTRVRNFSGLIRLAVMAGIA